MRPKDMLPLLLLAAVVTYGEDRDEVSTPSTLRS